MGASFADLATILARGISHCRMYFDGHPNVAAAARDFTALLRQLLAERHQTSFLLGIAGEKLIHDGKYLVGPSIVGSRLTRFAALLCCGGFEFDPRLEAAELRAFFALAARTTAPWSVKRSAICHCSPASRISAGRCTPPARTAKKSWMCSSR